MLRRDAAVFKAGTHAYFDHPTATEAAERPERSLRDLAGWLVTDARFEGDGLYAEMEVFPHYREIVESMADAIGLSIRASGTVEYGEVAGRSGPVLTGFTEAQSVDFVTAAGAGGRLVQLLESARARALEERGTWREDDHPRGYHGRFGHGGGAPSSHSGGGSGGGHAGDSRTGGERIGTSTGTGSGASREKGMPKTFATAEVPLKAGGTLKVGREHDGDRITLTHGDHTSSLSRDGAHKLARELTLADDWDTGEEDTFDGAGHIRKTGPGAYDVTLPDGTKLTMSRRDAVKFEQTLEGLDASSRLDTGNGDLDVFSPGRGKIGYRHLGDDGRPVEVVFDRRSYRKISDTIDRIIDDVDAPVDGKPVTRREISTNAGKVSVELFGKWGGRNPGDRLEIMPVGGDAGWGMVIDGPQQRDWADANDRIMQEAAAPASGLGVGLVEATTTKESAMPHALAEARTIGAWVESRLHLALTTLGDDMYGDGRLTRDERKALSSAVGAALDAFSAAIEDAAPQLYERGPYDDPDTDGQADAEMSEAAQRLAEAAGITANDLRDALCQAVKDVYGGEGIHVWVRDYTDEWVVFSMEDNIGPGEPDLFQQTYTLSGRTVTLTGDPVEVRAVTTYEPQPEQEPETGPAPAKSGPPSGEATAKTAPGTVPEPAHMKEGTMPELTEEQARQLAEAATLSTQLAEAMTRLNEAGTQIAQLTERADAADARATEANTKAQRLENTEAARRMVVEALRGSSIPATSHAALTESALRDLPTTDEGTLDTTAFKAVVESAITAKRSELAGLLEAAGVGSIRGLGESRPEMNEADIDKELAEAFAGLPGMTNEAAQIAANGRA
ncbi:hypothetical protein [Microbispora rosea]|uniref:hypothetical protein n=1 Tax=Microbispora rosea TaxID=58117 RepID=UPI00379AA55F